MRLGLRLALAASSLVLVTAGCGSTAAPIPIAVKAPPQTARLGWEEPYPAEAPALIFGVSSFTVTRDGWSAAISVENRSASNWKVGGPQGEAAEAFGVLLFPNDDLGELERRNRNNDLPAIRPARTFTPALPVILRPGTTWRGVMEAPGALAGGLWVRVSFGGFSSVGTPPKGARPDVVWFTDHAHRLERVAADPG
jgi:hypothetical protein